ncbi:MULTISPECIES: ABC transporter permease [unclassified Microbacterium]|uniref:ABC transporter permease n=1 Tax=unclassified Microbacterium TaxID=2609290 RepID=UPI0036590E72
MNRRRWGFTAISTIAPVAIVAVWWLVSRTSTSLYFPPLSEILKSLATFWLAPAGLAQLGASMSHLAVGLAGGIAVGVGGGIVLGVWRWGFDVVSPVLEFIRATPAIALVPIVLLILGIGPLTQIAMITAATVWPILLNTIDGVRSLDTTTRDVMTSYRLKAGDRLFRIILPGASPQIMVGINIAVTVALVMIIASELQGATEGVGYTLMAQQRSYDMAGMWSTIVLLGMLGFSLNLAFSACERILLAWHRQMNSGKKG